MRSRKRLNGFSLLELLVTIVILGLIVAVVGNSLLNLARRERANRVAAELAGWLDQVNGDTSRYNALIDSDPPEVCTVTIKNTGDLVPGDVMASIEPAACSSNQNIVTVPDSSDLYFNAPTVQLTSNVAQFVFTPRGTVAASRDSVVIAITVNNQQPLRCIRLTGLIGVLELGRDNQASTGPCGDGVEWNRF